MIVQGEKFRTVRVERVTGCGPKFDGRVKYHLERVSDGKAFTWLGSRHSKGVPAHARLSESRY